MPSIKLTKGAVERLRAPHPSGKQVLMWDSELRGFGVLLSGTTNARTYVVQRTLDGGLTRRITVGSVAELDLDKARHEAADLLHQLRHGRDPKQQRRSAASWTLRKACEEYLKARKNLRPSSVHLYKYAIERCLADWLDRPLASITAELVEEKHRKIAAQVARKDLHQVHWQSEPGANMANTAMRVFRALWAFVEDRAPDLPRNPVRRLSKEKQWYEEPRRERLVRNEEMPEFYRSIDGLANRTASDFLKIILFTGMRRSEAAALSWDEIDFSERVIRLPARRTKGRRKLDLPMTSFVRDLLVARRSIGREGDYVFPSTGRSGHIDDVHPSFEQIAKGSGIRVSAHDLRRGYVTTAESCDISPIVIKALVGHAMGRDMTERYAVLVVERLREPAQRVCDKLMELCEITPLPDAPNVARIA